MNSPSAGNISPHLFAVSLLLNNSVVRDTVFPWYVLLWLMKFYFVSMPYYVFEGRSLKHAATSNSTIRYTVVICCKTVLFESGVRRLNDVSLQGTQLKGLLWGRAHTRFRNWVWHHWGGLFKTIGPELQLDVFFFIVRMREEDHMFLGFIQFNRIHKYNTTQVKACT